MAKPKKKKRSLLSPRVKRAAVVGVLLILVQAIYVAYLAPQNTNLTTVEAINQTVMKQLFEGKIDSTRIPLLKIQLAVSDFQAKNQGSPPAKLTDLVPEYFDKVPNDPTGKPYEYTVEGKKFFLGMQKTKDTSTKSTEEEQKQQLLATLTKDINQIPPYDPTGKRDPFKPINLSPDSAKTEETTPLETISISNFTYTAYLAYGDQPKAILESSDGRGYTVKKGTKIGRNGGEIVEILQNKVVVIESEIDFAGERKTKTIELKIGIKGSKND